jgi:hypothetical protein
MGRVVDKLIGSDAEPLSKSSRQYLDEPDQKSGYLIRPVMGLFFSALALGMAGAADAGVYPNYPLDELLVSDRLPNSGKDTETQYLQNWLDAIANPSDSLYGTKVAFDYKLNQGDAGFNVSPNDLTSWYINVAPEQPGFFALKFGVPGNSAFSALPDTFYFLNIADLTKLVFSNAQVNYYTGGGACPFGTQGNPCNIGKLSHYTIYAKDSSEPPASVPEPMTLALFGLGLAGIGAVRRKKLMT